MPREAWPCSAGARPELEWWRKAPALILAGSRRPRAVSARYRLGLATLDIDSDDPGALEGFEAIYGECAGPAGAAAGPTVGCSVRVLARPFLGLVRFRAPGPPDLVPIAAALLQRLLRRQVSIEAFTPEGSDAEGWLALRPRDSGSAVAVVHEGDLLVDRADVDGIPEPPGFLVDFVVSAVMRRQSDVLFVHAASVGVRGAGALLAGRTETGKTTLSMSMAARGHDFLGDDVAAVLVPSRELLPFRQAVMIRPGPKARLVDHRLKNGSYRSEVRAGDTRTRVQLGELLPAARARAVPLRSAFFLRGFAARPAAEPFEPTLAHIEVLNPLSYELTVEACWGAAAGQRLMKFLRVIALLSGVPCYLLDVGHPEETADLIEATMEDAWA